MILFTYILNIRFFTLDNKTLRNVDFERMGNTIIFTCTSSCRSLPYNSFCNVTLHLMGGDITSSARFVDGEAVGVFADLDIEAEFSYTVIITVNGNRILGDTNNRTRPELSTEG